MTMKLLLTINILAAFSPIQEHLMILRAVERGVSEEKIAKALNVDVTNIIHKRTLLNGICEETVDLLKDKIVSIGVFQLLKKMKPYRQIEAATLMNDMNNYTTTYAKILLAGTRKELLANPEKPKKIKGLDEEQMPRIENEMSNLQREYTLVRKIYGEDVLKLTVAKTYIRTLLTNSRINRYLSQNHTEIHAEFYKDFRNEICQSTSYCRINFGLF